MAVAESKIAMSRALGAAFLNHQVEQLEKSVSNGASSGNWRDRDRKYNPGNNNNNSSAKRSTNSPGKPMNSSRRRGGGAGAGADEFDRTRTVEQAGGGRRRSDAETEKDADVVIADASVLIHSLNSLKKWSRNGREEVVIVPLEALNTLDLLKKGNNSLAQRARAASRILEAQVGANPRILVQRDEAFVLWDKIKFNESTSEDKSVSGGGSGYGSPEWVRRIICCAQWEVENANSNAASTSPNPSVVLAVCTSVNMSPQASTLKLPSSTEGDSAPMTPVPLPAPSHHSQYHSHTNKHEPRTTGVQVAHWAQKAGIKVLEVKPTPPSSSTHSNTNSGHNASHHTRSSSEEDNRPKRIMSRNRGNSNGNGNGNDKLRGGLVERSPAVLAMMEMVQRPEHKGVRLLARGEKLDPDT